MSSRRTNLGLLLALAIGFGTGVAAFAVGTSVVRWILVAHAAAGFGIVILARPKRRIAARGLSRRGLSASGAASIALAACVVLTVVTGFLHSTGLAVSLGLVTAMQVHVALALATLPLAIWHLVARPVRPTRTDLSRRALLRTGAVAGAAAIAAVGSSGLVGVAGLRGGGRRFTGSYRSERVDGVPATQWLTDSVPAIDPESWRLRVNGTRAVSLAELRAMPPKRLRATLDCTGGWYAEAEWGGVALDELLGGPGDARSIVVRSATGYERRFPVAAAPSLLLALRLGGEELKAPNGAPARLVVPGRRGFWWVKWVANIELSSAPDWWQPPFPLQ